LLLLPSVLNLVTLKQATIQLYRWWITRVFER